MTEEQKLIAKVAKAVAFLGEHFDSVRIVATYKIPGSKNGDKATHGMTTAGAGNFWAQKGSTEEWLQDCQNYDHAQAHADAFKATPPDIDGEEWKGGE